MKTRDDILYDLFKEIGAPTHIKGYGYAMEAVRVALEHPDMLYRMTKPGGMYDTVAKKFDSTASRVERAIRHCTEISTLNCPIETLKRIFGNSIAYEKGKPTNAQFISQLREEVLAVERRNSMEEGA